uniref:FtsJ domain-containing protein n=1 Tax=Parastrongyloides trichosuri TaxID=131310 RepID=A0A0N4ZIY0_PARTI
MKRRTKFNCKYKCDFHDGDNKIKTSPWISIVNAKPKCDVFEVVCIDKLTKNIIFVDLSLQLSKKIIDKNDKVKFLKESYPIKQIKDSLKESYPIKQIKDRYNVHVIVIDLMSDFSALRGFKKMMGYLKKNYKTINFKFLNKVGLNSKSNEYAFLMNRRVEHLYDFDSNSFKRSDYFH